MQNNARIQASGQRSGDTLYLTTYHLIVGTANPLTIAPKALISVQGTLALVQGDNFDGGRSSYNLVVRGDDETTTPLRLSVIPDTLQRGMRVPVTGSITANGLSLEPDQITVLATPPAELTLNDPVAAPITNNVLVVLIRFSPSADSFTQADVDQVMRRYSRTPSTGNLLDAQAFHPIAHCVFYRVKTFGYL